LTSDTGYSIGEISGKVKKSFWDEARGHVRGYVKRLVEDVLGACRQEAAGCLWHERSELRRDYCNGYYTRVIESVYGEIALRVPRLRNNTYAHELFERYERRSEELARAIEAAYLRGQSTRGLSAYMSEIVGVTLSAGGISRVLRRLDEALDAFHKSPLEDAWAVVYLDGMHVTVEGKAAVVLVAWGEKETGQGKCIDFRLAAAEEYDAWWRLVNRLWRRGLTGEGTRLFVHDGAGGLKKALEAVYPGHPTQRCMVHKLRDLHDALAGSPRRQRIMEKAKKIYEADTRDDARRRLRELMRYWRRREPQALALFAKDFDQTLSFYEMDKALWRRVRTTNPIERLLREIRRRIRPMGAFVNADSCRRLIFGVIRDIELRGYGLKKTFATPQNQITQFY
jgi:transposase-like protein